MVAGSRHCPVELVRSHTCVGPLPACMARAQRRCTTLSTRRAGAFKLTSCSRRLQAFAVPAVHLMQALSRRSPGMPSGAACFRARRPLGGSALALAWPRVASVDDFAVYVPKTKRVLCLFMCFYRAYFFAASCKCTCTWLARAIAEYAFKFLLFILLLSQW